MARASTSLDLSEFFSGDDSEGHRLVEFIQKRRGGLRTQNCLFMNYEPQRLSLNVQLEKISSAREELNKSRSKSDAEGTDKLDNIQQEVIHSDSLTEGVSEKLSDPIPAVEPLCSISPGGTQNPIPTLSPHLPTCSAPKSPRLSSIRRICVSPSDRLRRYSLKRLTNMCGGRRTLLQEFENTLGDARFDPPLYSTPQIPTQQKPLVPSNSIKTPEAENVGCSSTPKNSVINKSCCSHTDVLIQSLQRKDEELRNYMESIDNTIKSMPCPSNENYSTLNKAIDKSLHTINSPLRRTYTVEKGNIPGQVVLTPDKTTTTCQVKVIRSQTEVLPSKFLNTKEGNIRSPIQSRNVSETRRRCNTLEVSLTNDVQQQENFSPNPEAEQNTSQKENTSSVLPMKEVVLPIKNGQSDDTRNSNIIKSNRAMVVIPLNQARSNSCNESFSGNISFSKKKEINTATQPIQQDIETNSSPGYHQLADDNLKLTDILTDDDETSETGTAKNNSQAPLNLVQSVKKRLPAKLLLKRRLKIDDTQIMNLENKALKSSHPYNTRISKRRLVPLNRAPGIPLNGEQFAKELTKMSNYEILDLRKRNSMGEVFVLSGHRSRLSQKEAMEKKLQLDYQIKNEIIRRNLDNMREKQKSLNDLADIGDERNYNEHIPVPAEFCDSLGAQEDVDINCLQSSFIDEDPSDIISFKMNDGKCDRNKTNKQMTEELKQYLEVSQILTRKKFLNKSKRSLYSQEQYENVVYNQSTEKNVSGKRSSTFKKRSIPHVPSPPKIDNILITDIRIASPPPPFNVTLESYVTQKQNTRIELEEILHHTDADVIKNVTSTLPPEFEMDTNERTNPNTNNDALLFKIPAPPAFRKSARKIKRDKTPTNNVLESITNSHTSDNCSIESTNCTLRRSKRGNVPLKQKPIFQILFEQTMNKRLKNKNKKQNERGVVKVSNKNNKNDTVEPTCTESNKRGRKKKIPTIPENDYCINSIQQDAKMTNRMKGSSSKKSKIFRQPMNNYEDMIELNKNLENTPTTVEHLNNVFDELKESTNPTRNTPSQIAPTTIMKLKPFKINVARLKSLPQPTDRCDSESTAYSTISSNSNGQLIPWLKTINVGNDPMVYNAEIFKEMRISAASILTFTQLQGVEYAFYDTEEKACLGYLRFQPHQIKARKRAKRFHLHFIALSGIFRITADNKNSIINVGDMVAIEKSVYYEIENISDDIGILMVIKK